MKIGNQYEIARIGLDEWRQLAHACALEEEGGGTRAARVRISLHWLRRQPKLPSIVNSAGAMLRILAQEMLDMISRSMLDMLPMNSDGAVAMPAAKAIARHADCF